MPEDDGDTLELSVLKNFVHQVINPLNGVLGTLDNLVEGEVPPDRHDQRLRAVRAQLEHAVLLVRNLAFVSRIASGDDLEDSESHQRCVLPRTIIEAALFYQEAGLTEDVKIHLTDRETQYVVNGPSDLMRQVFMNLFDNGIKYAFPGTTIRVEPWEQKKTGDLLVEVVNEGVGFKASERERIFERGYRGVDAQAKVASGTGLGLYICKRILVDVFGGDIRVEHSQKKSQTTFRLRLHEWEYAS